MHNFHENSQLREYYAKPNETTGIYCGSRLFTGYALELAKFETFLVDNLESILLYEDSIIIRNAARNNYSSDVQGFLFHEKLSPEVFNKILAANQYEIIGSIVTNNLEYYPGRQYAYYPLHTSAEFFDKITPTHYIPLALKLYEVAKDTKDHGVRSRTMAAFTSILSRMKDPNEVWTLIRKDQQSKKNNNNLPVELGKKFQILLKNDQKINKSTLAGAGIISAISGVGIAYGQSLFANTFLATAPFFFPIYYSGLFILAAMSVGVASISYGKNTFEGNLNLVFVKALPINNSNSFANRLVYPLLCALDNRSMNKFASLLDALGSSALYLYNTYNSTFSYQIAAGNEKGVLEKFLESQKNKGESKECKQEI